jgi:hypothetical protein
MTEPTSDKPAPHPAGRPPRRSLIGRLDRTISRLNIILSTPSGTDSLLRTVAYTAQFLTGALTTLQAQPLAGLAGAAQSTALALPGSTALLALVPAAAPRSRALTALISDFRSFSRLWGLLGLWALAGRLLRTPPQDAVLRAVAWGQCIAYIAYQALENRAYLAGKGVVPLPRDGAKGVVRGWLWSSRAWMAAVGLEFVRLARVAQLGARREQAAGKADEVRAEEVAQWRRDLLVNLANAPLTAHWSLEGGTLGETAVGFLGMVAGLVGFQQRWTATGKLVK